MAAASQPVSFRIERHEVIEQTEDCLICGDEEVPVDVSGEMERFQFTVILSGSLTKCIAPEEFVHLTCHPNQAYHYGCLKKWLESNASCPLDRRPVNAEAPYEDLPGINKLGSSQQKVHQLALGIFFNK